MASLNAREIQNAMDDNYSGEIFGGKVKTPKSQKMGKGQTDAKRSKKSKEAAKAKKAPKTIEEHNEKMAQKEHRESVRSLEATKNHAAKVAEKSGADMDTYVFKDPRYKKYNCREKRNYR